MIGKLSAQHPVIDFRDFLDQIDRQTQLGLAIHAICDNLSTHKASVVRWWLLAHPPVQLHLNLTYFSWISQVERRFAELQRHCLDSGVFCSLDELTTTLEDWIKTWNAHARPVQVDQDRRPDHRPHLPLLLTYLWTGTIDRPRRSTRWTHLTGMGRAARRSLITGNRIHWSWHHGHVHSVSPRPTIVHLK